MKSMVYAAIAGVVLIGFMMKNESTTANLATVQLVPERGDKADDPDQDGPKQQAGERTVQLIRRSFSADKSLPTNGKNVKLIVSGDTITLRGLVRSEQEKLSIGALARQYAGSKSIDNKLEVIQ